MIDSPHLLFARIKHAADIEEKGSYVVLLAPPHFFADWSCAKEANLRGKKRRRQSSMAPRQIGTMPNQTVNLKLYYRYEDSFLIENISFKSFTIVQNVLQKVKYKHNRSFALKGLGINLNVVLYLLFQYTRFGHRLTTGNGIIG